MSSLVDRVQYMLNVKNKESSKWVDYFKKIVFENDNICLRNHYFNKAPHCSLNCKNPVFQERSRYLIKNRAIIYIRLVFGFSTTFFLCLSV